MPTAAPTDLVERTRHKVDRRRYVLRLSRAGEQLLRRTEGEMSLAESDARHQLVTSAAYSSAPSSHV